MQSKAKAPTKLEKRRMARIVELGCVACRKGPATCPMPPEVHHLLDGGVRRGHALTVCLCGWHHRGNFQFDMAEFMPTPVAKLTARFGPSLYHDARAFRARYGSDDELLAFQDELLEREGP